MPRLPPQLSAVRPCQTPLEQSGKAAGAVIREPGDLPSTRSAPGGVLRFCVPSSPQARALAPVDVSVERGAIPDSTAPEPGGESPEAGCAPQAASEAARDLAPAVTLLICTTCRAPGNDAPQETQQLAERDGARLLASACAASLPEGVAVEGVSCLANCKRALSAAMVRRDGWTYVFGDLSPDSAADLLAGAALLAGSEDGLMPWRGRPDVLKRGMVARIPPLPLKETR